jgi:hypothetical protein
MRIPHSTTQTIPRAFLIPRTFWTTLAKTEFGPLKQEFTISPKKLIESSQNCNASRLAKIQFLKLYLLVVNHLALLQGESLDRTT